MTDLQPVFCGNFEYNIDVREIERLFDDFGPIERVDMKSGYAFVFMRDSRDGDDAIRKLDGMEFGRRRRPLRVEWAKGNGETKRREEKRRKNCTPTDTLFVVNFDPKTTQERDLEKHFFFLWQTEKARNGLSLSRLLGRTLTVEYVARDGRSTDEQDASQDRGARQGRNTSPPPRRRRHSRSPDYGTRQRNRNRSVTPPRRHRRSPSPRSQRSDRSPAKTQAGSPVYVKRSPSQSARSTSPKPTGSRSPSTVPYQDANSRAASRSVSRSPDRHSSSPAGSR
ncbi:TPA: hypothetical protein ACH3X3_013383 [Trebouxia sp. C0006]